MDVYYFVKYNGETNFKHIEKYAKTNAILCFDFEDSIKCWNDPAQDPMLKDQYRNYFGSVYTNILSKMSAVKTGIRINNDLSEIRKDIKQISTFRIHSILIPKAETSSQIRTIENLLIENKVYYDEIIPIIESSQGLLNLPEIIQASPHKISKIGFGHCDYNLSSHVFPFFHQNSTEYWIWIANLSSIARRHNKTLINSAFLDLGDSSFFHSMLFHLHDLFGNNFGQFALTTEQAISSNTFRLYKKQESFNRLLNSRLDLRVNKKFAIDLVKDFESENKNRGFTISKAKRLLISPQEYLAAKSYLADNKSGTLNFTFVGGCFPVQHNINFEDLFHQKLRRKIKTLNRANLNINIIRYERFSNCLSKIITCHKARPIDILVFHIRPEPFLRLVKFYYKYLNNDGKLSHSFNIPLFKMISPEKYDFLILGRRLELLHKQNDSGFHKTLVDINYKTGFVLGNTQFALNKYFGLVSDVINFCRNTNIKLILLGPALRYNTSFEPVLCRKLNSYFKDKLTEIDVTYIEGLDEYSGKSDPLFHSNGIHATETYHELISERLYNEVKK